LIIVLKDLENDLKQEIAGLRKEVREIKEEWKKRMEGLEKKIDTMEKKMKEIERATIDRSKEEDEERVARITNLVTEQIGRTETGEKQQEEEEEREETKKEVMKLKRSMENRERRERKNNLIIKGLRRKGKKNLIESAQKFLEEEFEVKEGVREIV